MIWKTWLSQHSIIKLNESAVIKFEHGIEFSLIPQNIVKLEPRRKYQTFDIKDKKGDFKIGDFRANKTHSSFDDENNSVYFETNVDWFFCTITVSTKVQYNKTAYVCVPYDMHFSVSHMKFLEMYDFNEGIITLPYYSMLKFRYYLKRINEYEVELLVKNPHKIKLNGYSENLKRKHELFEDWDLTLSFEFDPNLLMQKLFPNNENEQPLISPLSNLPLKNTSSHPCLYDMISDPKYADAIIISSDKVEIPCSRSILAKYSTVFAKLFDEKYELPAKIAIENCDADAIISALKFCFGKHDEEFQCKTEGFHFINKFAIFPLEEQCSKNLDKCANIENVCEIVQIAYTNNFTDLKQKCLKLLSETKMLIDASKMKALPNDILFDLLYV